MCVSICNKYQVSQYVCVYKLAYLLIQIFSPLLIRTQTGIKRLVCWELGLYIYLNQSQLKSLRPSILPSERNWCCVHSTPAL